MSAALETFIAEMPKAELHVHQVGSASPRIVAQLAERHPGKVPSDPDDLVRFFVFNDFAHFITIYLSVVDLIRTAEDVRLLTYEVATEMAGQNIRYAELTVTPYISVSEDLPGEAFLEAIEDARLAAARDHGIELRWIFDIPADFGIPAAEVTASIACDHDVPGLVGFGIGGAERGFPRPMFKPYVDRARAAGLHSVPHAGETTGPQTIWDAIRDLGAERIEHGISAVQDRSLLEHLVEHGITLDVCPTSNVALKVVADLDSHPIRELVSAGVRVTVNSDDPPMFGTTLTDEYRFLVRHFGYDADGVERIALNAVRASFLPPDEKARLLSEFEGAFAELRRELGLW